MTRGTLRIGLPSDRGFKLGLVLAALEGLSAVALLACSAWLISAAAEQPPIMYLNIVIVGVRGFALGRAFFRYTQRLTLHDSAFKLQTILRPKLVEVVSTKAPAGLGGVSRANLATQLVADVEEIQNLGVRSIAPVVQSAVITFASVAALAVLSPGTGAWRTLLLGVLLSAGLAILASLIWNKRRVEVSAKSRADLQSRSSAVLEHLAVLSAYEWDDAAVSGIAEVDRVLVLNQKRFALTAGLGNAIFGVAAAVTVNLLALRGGMAVQNGLLDHRMLAVVALLPLAVYEIVAQLQSAAIGFQKYSASAKRVTEELNSPVAASVAPSLGNSHLTQVQSLQLIAAEFGYPGSAGVVGPFNLDLDTSSNLVIRGPSGIGKSTIAYALAGFIHPSAGLVTVNHLNLSEFDEASLRRKIGYLEQSPTIFDGSIRTNLTIAAPNATDQILWDALDRVALKGLFEAREGLETQLGERGTAISGGEAHRVAIARALLAQFEVMVFDEPTANLDGPTAQNLWSDLHRLTGPETGRIGVFITHDLELPLLGSRVLEL